MKKKNIITLITFSLILISSCQVQTSLEFESFIQSQSLSVITQMKIMDFLDNSAVLYLISLLSGILISLAGFVYFILHRRDKSLLFLSSSALAVAAVYSLPFWTGRIDLPAQFWSPAMVRGVILLLYYFSFRQWCRKAFYHRTKIWSYITTTVLFSLTLIGTILSGLYPVLSKVQWPVPLLASILILDALVNSILSFQRKNDRSGIAGVMIMIPPAAGAAWIILTSGYASLFLFLNHLFYLLPALMIPWQLILTTALVQRRYFKEEQRSSILMKMVEDEELQKSKLEDLIEKLDKRNEENTRIPDYSLECARRLLGYTAPLPLNLPSSWTGEHRIVSDPSTIPVLGAWNRKRTLLFSEGTDKQALLPLLYLKESFDSLQAGKPALLLKGLNEKMSGLPFNIEKSLSGTLLYFMEDELICGTAGNVRVYLQKKEGRIVPVQGDEKGVTYRGGLGRRPTTREDGKPYRISVEKGDRIVVVSCSLTDRELEGKMYGQKSLYRVLNSHASANPEKTIQAILKDFDDFDLGNTQDRHIYAGVFTRI